MQVEQDITEADIFEAFLIHAKGKCISCLAWQPSKTNDQEGLCRWLKSEHSGTNTKWYHKCSEYQEIKG